MSTSTLDQVDVVFLQDLEERWDDEVQCYHYGGRNTPIGHLNDDQGRRVPMGFGLCSAGGIRWRRWAACCGQVIFVCQEHYEIHQEVLREVLRHSRQIRHVACGTFRDPDTDIWGPA